MNRESLIIMQLMFGVGLFSGLTVAHPIFSLGVFVCLGSTVFFMWKLGNKNH